MIGSDFLGFPGGVSGKELMCQYRRQVALIIKNLPANAEDLRDWGSVLDLGRFPEGGHGNPLQYSCLENPHGQRSLESYSPYVQSQTRLKRLSLRAQGLSVFILIIFSGHFVDSLFFIAYLSIFFLCFYIFWYWLTWILYHILFCNSYRLLLWLS